VIGEDTTLGSKKLRMLLVMGLGNATTDSLWPLTDSPRAKYNDPTVPAAISGKCLVGDFLDGEVGTVMGRGIPVVPKLFTYAR